MPEAGVHSEQRKAPIKEARVEGRQTVLRELVKDDYRDLVQNLFPSDRVVKFQRVGMRPNLLGVARGEVPLETTRKLLEASADGNVYTLLFGMALTADTPQSLQNIFGALEMLNSHGFKNPEITESLQQQREEFVSTRGHRMKINTVEEDMLQDWKLHMGRSAINGKTEGAVMRELWKKYFGENMGSLSYLQAEAYLGMVCNQDLPIKFRKDLIKYTSYLDISDSRGTSATSNYFNRSSTSDLSLLGEMWWVDPSQRETGQVNPLQAEIDRLRRENDSLRRMATNTQKAGETARQERDRLREENERLRKDAARQGLSGETHEDPFENRSDFDIFGLSEGSSLTEADLLKRYKRLSHKYHPDPIMAALRNIEDDPKKIAMYEKRANRRMQRVGEAFERLSRQTRR